MKIPRRPHTKKGRKAKRKRKESGKRKRKKKLFVAL